MEEVEIRFLMFSKALRQHLQSQALHYDNLSIYDRDVQVMEYEIYN